ncbi:translation initiation factor IF-1 [Candidatus Microgenomates bacterium]|jgi:translation initiation factor IF-1|nr:MAG: translation initiation factor IF-1 [Candidatus Microgenomates bacterium]
MLKEGEVEKEGVVLENLPNTTFRIETADKKQYLCTLSGKMRMHRIRILPGDRVKFVVTPYDPERGRITYRLK